MRDIDERDTGEAGQSTSGQLEAGRGIVFFFDEAFILRRNGSHVRALELLNWLTARYGNVSVYSYSDFRTPWTDEAKRMFQEAFPGVPLYLDRFSRLLRLQNQFKKLVLAMIPSSGKFVATKAIPGLTPGLTRLRRDCPDALWVFNFVDSLTQLNGVKEDFVVETHDVKFLKWSRRTGGKVYGTRATMLMRTELVALELARALVTITLQEKHFFSRLAVDTPLFYVSSYAEATPAAAAVNRSGPRQRDLLFVGANNHFNVQGLCGFLRENRDWLGRYKLTVCGDICNAAEVRAEAERSPGVELAGFVEDLAPYYASSGAVIAPVNGTGLKIKVVEALAHGMPVFGTEHVTDGLIAGYEGCVRPLDRREIEETLADEAVLAQMSRAAIEYHALFVKASDLDAFATLMDGAVRSPLVSKCHT